jgi:hypothetical protein
MRKIVRQFTLLFTSAFLFYDFQGVAQQSTPVTSAIVREVIQTSNYTYLDVKAGKEVKWLAVPLGKYKSGDTVYYQGGLVMKDFKSKELNRTFPSVIFLEGVGKTPAGADKSVATIPGHTGKANPGKENVKVEPAPGGITIAHLFSDKKKYGGKTVKMRGKVVKYNARIMGKNWAHIQDGSNYNGKYDLAVTLKDELKVGDVVTLEGKVSLDRDFGSGYFFDVIVEDAVVK